jgi:hypothetical protein
LFLKEDLETFSVDSENFSSPAFHSGLDQLDLFQESLDLFESSVAPSVSNTLSESNMECSNLTSRGGNISYIYI